MFVWKIARTSARVITWPSYLFTTGGRGRALWIGDQWEGLLWHCLHIGRLFPPHGNVDQSGWVKQMISCPRGKSCRALPLLCTETGQTKFWFGGLNSPGLSWRHLNSWKLRCRLKCFKNHKVASKRSADCLIELKEAFKVHILVWVSPFGVGGDLKFS